MDVRFNPRNDRGIGVVGHAFYAPRTSSPLRVRWRWVRTPPGFVFGKTTPRIYEGGEGVEETVGDCFRGVDRGMYAVVYFRHNMIGE